MAKCEKMRWAGGLMSIVLCAAAGALIGAGPAEGQIIVCFHDVPGDCERSREAKARARVEAANTPEQRAAAARQLEEIQREIERLGKHRAEEARLLVEMRERAEKARAPGAEAHRGADPARAPPSEAQAQDPNSPCARFRRDGGVGWTVNPCV